MPELAERALAMVAALHPYTEQNMFRHMWELRGQLLERLVVEGEGGGGLARVLGRYNAFVRRNELLLQVAKAQRADGSVLEMLTGAGEWTPRRVNLAAHPPGAVQPDGRPLLDWTAIAGARTVRPQRANYDHVVVHTLLDLLRQQEFDAVVELGSGLGERLFELYLAGGPAHIPYFGAELWETGRRVADRLAALEPGMDFRSVAFDLAAPDFRFLEGFRRVLLFSNCAIYCVPTLPASFAAALASAAERVTGVHFEMVHNQVAHRPAAEAGDLARHRAHNTDFIAHMFQAQDNGTFRIHWYAPDAYAVSSGQPITILHWQAGTAAP